MDENPPRSQQLVKGVKDAHKGHAAFRGRLRMDEVDDERRRKQKRVREDDTRDQKTTFGAEEGSRKRRQAWGL